MASIRNLDSVWTAPEGRAVTVGNNRTITRDRRADGATVFTCRLHGSPVVTVTPHGAAGTVSIKLDACGYLTTTTCAAMRDFLHAFGIVAGVSRAGGVLSARWVHDDAWHERESSDGDSMSFVADRNPATIPAPV